MVYQGLFRTKITILFILLNLSGCVSVDLPNLESGQVNLEKDEIRLMTRAKETVEYVDHSGLIYDDVVIENYLNEILAQLIPAQLSQVHLDIKILKDPDLNAFGLANGRIYIHTGVLAAADNEAQIAALIGHEVTHILHRHMVKQFRSTESALSWWDGVGVATGGIGMIFGVLATQSSISGFSKDLETEADEYGFQLMNKAGYDVRQSIKMFEALKDYMTGERASEPFFFSSHPHIALRIKNFTRLVNEHPQSVTRDSREDYYKDIMHELFVFNIQLSLQKGIYHTAESQLTRLTAHFPHDKRGWSLTGDLYRERQDAAKGTKQRDKKADYSQALKAYDQALRLDANFLEAVRGKGRVLYAMGDKAQAKIYFQQYLDRHPQAPDKTFIQRLIQ